MSYNVFFFTGEGKQLPKLLKRMDVSTSDQATVLFFHRGKELSELHVLDEVISKTTSAICMQGEWIANAMAAEVVPRARDELLRKQPRHGRFGQCLGSKVSDISNR
jgi:hypothetical protein